jgi:hypothetical protein
MNGRNSARRMEISSNLNLNSVDGTASPKRSKSTPTGDADGDQDRVTLTDMTSIQSALENTAASRPDAVARARQLINDPNYPSPSVTSQVSQLLADKILAQTD